MSKPNETSNTMPRSAAAFAILQRLADLTGEASRITQRVEVDEARLPALLLSRLHVHVDGIVAELAQHRMSIEDVCKGA